MHYIMTEVYSVSADFGGVDPNVGQLGEEIINSSITTSLIGVTLTGDVVDIIFVTTISGAEKTTLDSLVSAHVPTSLPNIDFATSTGSDGTKTMIASAQTANRTLTIPDVTDTFICKATTDTLTNKIITGSTNTVSADNLKTAGADVAIVGSVPWTNCVLQTTSATVAGWQQRFKIFHAYTNVSTAINAGFTAIPWNVEQRKDSIYTHTANSSDITLGETGKYFIIVTVTTDVTSGTSRSESTARIMQDTGGGFTEIVGTRGGIYNRRLGQGRGSCTLTWVGTFTATFIIRVEAQRDSGTSSISTEANYCRIFIRKLD